MSILEERQVVVAPVTRREVLHRAADLLEEFGWVQGDYGPWATGGVGAFCATGAVWRAQLDLGYEPSVGDEVTLAVGVGHLTAWNDRPRRNAKQVVARLRQAAETA